MVMKIIWIDSMADFFCDMERYAIVTCDFGGFKKNVEGKIGMIWSSINMVTVLSLV